MSPPRNALQSDQAAHHGPDGEWTVNQTIAVYPATVAVFNRFGIDACCGGAATIDAAAARDGADAALLLRAVREAAGHP